MNEQQLKNIYLKQINEALERLNASEVFFERYTETKYVYEIDSCILQLRKALECIAFSAIAPHKIAYAQFRNNDFSKDFNAKKILYDLNKINEKFYPIPLLDPVETDGVFHFERKEKEFLSKKRFEKIHDRLGKYLHADNPWGSDKGLLNLITEYPLLVKQIQGLLKLHFVTIKTPEFNGVWLAESDSNFTRVRIITGQADGEFCVK